MHFTSSAYRHRSGSTPTINTPAGAPEATSSAQALLTFWLPLFMIAGTIWISHYRPHYALSAGGLTTEQKTEIDAVGETDRARQVAFPLLGLLGLALFVSKRNEAISIDKPIAVLAVLLLFVVGSSVVWSEETNTTIRRLVIVFLVAMAALGVGRVWEPIDLCRAAMLISGMFAVASILVEIRAGTFLSGEFYRFSGAFHPNRQAVCTGILTISSLCYFRHTRSFKYLAVALVGIGLTKLTGSRGGLLALLLAISATYFLTLAVRGRIATVLLLCIALSCGLITLAASSIKIPSLNSLAKLGRTDESAQASTLTGRIPIWEECITAIGYRPLLGYGYGAFWTPKRVQEFYYIHNWEFSNAHSVYLETALDIGVVGVLIILSIVALALMRSFKAWKTEADFGSVFIIGLLCAGLVHGLVEAVYVNVGLASILSTIGIAILSMHRIEGATT